MKLPSFMTLKKKITTSADVADQVARNAAMLADAGATLARLEAERTELLLNADDATVTAHETKVADARLTLARLQARAEALEAHRTDILAQEAAEALTRRRQEVDDRANACERWLREAYPALAHRLVNGLSELHAIEADVLALNEDLADVGRSTEALRPVERRVNNGDMIQAPTMTSVITQTRLQPLTGEVEAPGWAMPLWV